MRSAEIDRTPWLLGAVLLLGLAVQALLPAPPLPAVSVPHVRATRGGDAFTAPTLPAYAAIAEHPLFSPARSGAEGEVADVAAAGTFALLGVAAGAGHASAVIRYSGGGGVQVVALGATLLGWRVSAVGGDMAVVSRNGVSQTLKVGAPALVGAAAVQAQQP